MNAEAGMENSKMNTVVVTGASQGLGLVIANRFASKGWQVIGTGRSERPGGLDPSAHYQQFDASISAECETFWNSVKDKVQGEVCLVNNAGGYVSGGLVETSPEDFDTQMRSNYFSAVYMTRGLVEAIARAKIINVISSSALASHANNSAYGAAKAAERHFFQSLQREFKPVDYQITNLYPSDIATHDANSKAIDPIELADFIIDQIDTDRTYYARDVTLYPRV